jgi:hypothetical protein
LLLQPGVEGDPEQYVKKLGSLVRLALSAGARKLDHLRARQRQGLAFSPLLHDGFLLDRARLVVAPVGLDHVVNAFTNRSLAAGRPARELGERILSRLQEVLRHDARRVHLDCCLDGPWTASLNEIQPDPCVRFSEHVASLTPWDATVRALAQGRAAGKLHEIARHGTLALLLSERTTPEEVVDLLGRFAQQTGLVRVRLVRVPAKLRNTTPGPSSPDPGDTP